MAAKRGRTMGFEMSNAHRLKIANSNILKVLLDHVEGKRDMSATQVSAGLGLLRKVMPDLSQSELTHTHKHDAQDYSRDELLALLAEARQRNDHIGAIAANGRDNEPDSVH